MLLSGRFVTKSMRASRIAGIFLLTLLAFVAATSSAAAEERRVYPGYIVTTKQSQNFAVAADASPSLSAKGLHVQRELGRKQVLVMPGSAQFAVSADEAPQQVVPYNPATDLCPSLLSSGAVESCSPNYEVRASAIPNDTNFGGLWGMSESMGIDAPGAWEVSTGSNDVVVAIIDTGIDYTHPDLAANIWTNTLETPGNGIDDDHNGIVDDVHGANFSHENNPANNLGKGDPRDNNMHGTHVAGTIGGIGNNARGVAGVNWNVKMMALKFLNSSGSGSLADAVSAINYMIAMKNRGVNIRVANNSWGGGGYSAALFNAIGAARDAGIIFVAAAGNDANDNDAEASYPASYEVSNVVSVAAIDSDQNLASFSNYGRTKVDIAAPGVGIFSTVPGGNYASLSGTSMATPHVAGALALLLAHEPGLTNEQALTRMYESGVPLTSLQDVVRTARKLNAKRMILKETAPVIEPAPELPCHYSIEEIAFNPDQSVANQPIVLPADELSFYTLDMPFAFPFYRSQVTSLKVSE
ncbi:MAG: S8 family serine peptidase [Deltaproteobacteria bacterium]|nr:S8 family serine peptidase [Deltaproteobacteria bacterium]